MKRWNEVAVFCLVWMPFLVLTGMLISTNGCGVPVEEVVKEVVKEDPAAAGVSLTTWEEPPDPFEERMQREVFRLHKEETFAYFTNAKGELTLFAESLGYPVDDYLLVKENPPGQDYKPVYITVDVIVSPIVLHMDFFKALEKAGEE